MEKEKNRATYRQLKTWALEDYFIFCRDSGLIDRRSHEQVLGRVSYSFENGFECPTEDLMWQVVLLILTGGWHSELEAQARKIILNDLATHGLDNLLAGVPKEEADEFRHDLHILKLI